MTTFTREQLEAMSDYHGISTEGDLAAFALALLDQNEALRRDKFQLGEERAAEWKRAEKAEAERDEANDERDDAVDRWARRAREAEAACKELLQVQAERDRLREENKSLREANEIDLGEKAPLIFENAELKARNEILREELRDAEEAIRYVAHGDGYDCYRSESSPEPRGVVGYTGVGGVWFAFPDEMQAAVRRARERTESNKEQEDK